ncbi:ribokinase [Pseudooceanicola antarcticus]|uniref:Ribokinase n=1 Tax=Pseudooceanicola antarcticus TaxID=1247613 RepID=A0A285HVH5_9RHOB|nr:ribokinase [Pseudooceanicola antarcticus]PJE27574.1 ribokinase [Pseudooceanicola antarcticus]SNY38786.1 ribokinase [Pseudooceanicola antarcticus]
MPVWNLGSVNADLVFQVPHLPAPGETLAATDFKRGLGGKGANMSVAVARAGSSVHHIGAVGEDGLWMKERLSGYGVSVDHVAELAGPSGQAVIELDAEGENRIIILSGANARIDVFGLDEILSEAQPGDWAIFQNETNGLLDFARAVKARGLPLAHAAAPFDAEAVAPLLEHLDLLVMNEVEAAQLEAATGMTPAALPVADVVITLGAKGALWVGAGGEQRFEAPKVTPVDTTGAGDTFTGYLVAALEQGLDMADAITLAQKAASVMVTRLGTADVIPLRDEL